MLKYIFLIVLVTSALVCDRTSTICSSRLFRILGDESENLVGNSFNGL